jgi:DNA polymerase-1
MYGFLHWHRGEVPSIQMVDPMTMSCVLHDMVVAKWNVTPNQLGDVLALAGDSADNIPGVPGIGPKIAASLISEYGTLDQLLEQVETVKQKGRRTKLINKMDKARLSRQLGGSGMHDTHEQHDVSRQFN